MESYFKWPDISRVAILAGGCSRAHSDHSRDTHSGGPPGVPGGLSVRCCGGGVSLGARRSQALTFSGSSYGKGAGVHLPPRTLVTRERLGLSVLGFWQEHPSSLSSHVWPAEGPGLGGIPTRGYSKLRQPSLSFFEGTPFLKNLVHSRKAGTQARKFCVKNIERF